MASQTTGTFHVRALIRSALVSWHLVSLSLLAVAVLSVVASTDVDHDLSNSIGDASSPDPPTTTLAQNSSSNASEEASGPRAADCAIDVGEVCPDDRPCSQLGGDCILCDFNTSCLYGSKQKARCVPKPNVNCSGDQVFEREYDCRYCYQLPPWLTWCNRSYECRLNKPRNYFPAQPFFFSTCWAKNEHLCMGRRCFHKQLPCNWSQGYKWSTALLLSIFLGGFGVDRFYLGLWREGIGKLLSFGGLGVWTLVDVILIAVGYVGPWDGSLYI